MSQAVSPRERREAYRLELLGRRHVVRRASGREALHEPSHFELAFRIPAEEQLDVDAASGSSATLFIEREGQAPRTIRLRVTEAIRSAGQTHGASTHEVAIRLVAPIDVLRHRVDIRVFRDRDVPTIVTEVLAGHGIDLARRLEGSHAPRAYTVQYRESDLDFARRLLEDEGIFLVCRDDGGCLIGDAATSFDDAPLSLPFLGRSGLEARDDLPHLLEIGVAGELVCETVTARDFDFERPSLDVAGTTSTGTPGGGEWYAYPSSAGSPAAAAQRAARLAEAFAARAERLEGIATAVWLRPGLRIQVGNAPSGISSELLVSAVNHAHQLDEGSLEVGFSATTISRVPRPLPETPRPRQPAPMIGYVVGPPGADIHTDHWGRTKVHFPWDRLQPKDDDASDWIPTLQDNTGQSIGIPRIGWEVLVQYVEGDPDRPVIVGRLYNGLDPTYTVLPTRKTWTALRSVSSPRIAGQPDGENIVQMEDLAGEQFFYLQAERDRLIETDNDRSEKTLASQMREIDRDETIGVGRDRTIDVGTDRERAIGGNQAVAIAGDHRVRVRGPDVESAVASRSVTIGSTHRRRINETDSVSVDGALRERIGAAQIDIAAKTHSTVASTLQSTTIGGALIEIAKDAVSNAAARFGLEIVGALLLSKAKQAVDTRVGGAHTMTVGAKLDLESGEEILFAGQEGITWKLGSGALRASKKISLKVKDTAIRLEAQRIAFDAVETLRATAQARNDLNAASTSQNDGGGT